MLEWSEGWIVHLVIWDVIQLNALMSLLPSCFSCESCLSPVIIIVSNILLWHLAMNVPFFYTLELFPLIL